MGVRIASLVREVTAGGETYRLRPMVVGDLERVIEIEAGWAPAPWSLATFRNEIGVPFSRASVVHSVREPEVVSGYVVRWLVAGEMHLLSFAIRAQERGKGLGRALLDGLLVEADEDAVELVTLEVEAANSVARHLYAARGFTEVRRREGYYGAGRDAVVMDLRLGRVVS